MACVDRYIVMAIIPATKKSQLMNVNETCYPWPHARETEHEEYHT